MNSRRMWNLIRVVVAVSLILQSVVSFSAIPVSAKAATPVEARAMAEPVEVQNAEPFVSPVVTPQPSATVEATVTPGTRKAAVLTGTLILSETVKTLDATGG